MLKKCYIKYTKISLSKMSMYMITYKIFVQKLKIKMKLLMLFLCLIR